MGQDVRRLFILFFIPGAICGVGVQECYVCRADGEPSLELEKQFPNEQLPICGVKGPERKVCPPGSQGCLTTYEGLKKAKSCSELYINDCSQANNVKYCYCSGTLCNKEEKTIKGPETDDEDLSEGSGEGSTMPTTVASTTTKKVTKTVHASGCSISQNPGLLLLILISLLHEI